MRSNPRGSWYLAALALVAVAVVVAAVLEVGPPSSSARVSHEIVTAQNGVIQSTVTGSGNIEPGTQEYANFKTSGTLSSVYVSVGQHVQEGQLLATLDPTSAQLSVDQAQLSLDAAKDELKAAEDGGSSGSSGSSGSGSTSNANTTVDSSSTEFVSETVRRPTNTPVNTTTSTTSTTPTTPTSTSTTPKPTSTTPRSTGTKPSSRKSSKPSSSSDTHTTASTGSSQGSPSSSASTKTTTTTPSPSAIASAKAQVDSAELNLRSAQTALAETKLYAPASGTIVSLESTSPGDEISAGSNSSSNSTGSGSSGSGSSGTSGTGSSSSTAGSLGSSSSSSSSSSGFAEIVNTDAMTMTVALSESDIAKVKVGQQATVTLDALTGVELAAHVSSIAVLGTDSNGVVSYDVTLTLDQSNSQVRPGMSASAAIVTQQAQGVNLPNSAVTGGGSVSSVELLKNGKTVSTPVVVGLKGDTRTQIVSGLSAGDEVVVTTTLPSLSSTAASSSSGTLGTGRARLFGGGGFGGGGFGGGGFPAGGGFGGGG